MATLAIDYKTGVTNTVSNVLTFIPKLLVFVLIVVVGYFVAKAISKILTKLLQRVGFDSLVERGGVKKALEKSQYDAAAILAKLVFYAIMLFVLSTAFAVFGRNPIGDYLHAVIAYLPLVFVAIVIVVIGAAVAAAAKLLIQNSLGGLSYGTMLANAASTIIIALFAIAALNTLHIAQTVVNALLYAVLAAVVGVVVVAVGGGEIATMSGRWQSMADKYDEEKDNVRQQVRSTPRLRERAQQAKAKRRTPWVATGGALPAPADSDNVSKVCLVDDSRRATSRPASRPITERFRGRPERPDSRAPHQRQRPTAYR